MANGAYQADSTSERIKVGQERAKAEGRPPGRPPALSPDQVRECKLIFAENPSVSRVARIMKISWSTANQGNLRWKFSTGRHAVTGRDRPVCDCPEPCACYAEGKE